MERESVRIKLNKVLSPEEIEKLIEEDLYELTRDGIGIKNTD